MPEGLRVDEFDSSAPGALGVVVVDAVVVAAQRGQVVDVSFPSVFPCGDVVDFAGVGGLTTPGHWAAGGDGAGEGTLLLIGEALRPVEVDCPVLWVEDGGLEFVVAGCDGAVEVFGAGHGGAIGEGEGGVVAVAAFDLDPLW